MEKFSIKLIFLTLLFFFIYNPPLSFLPMNSGIIIGGLFFVFMLCEFLIHILLERTVFFNKKILYVSGLFLFVSLYSYLVAIISGSYDNQVFKSSFSFILFYLPGSFGIVKLMKKYFTSKEVIKIIILVCVIQSIIILVMLVNPTVKNFLFSVLRDGSARVEKNLLSGGFRFLGFAYNTTWDLSIVQSIGIMSIAILFKLDKSEINVKNALFFILLSISVFLTGRTGFLGIIFALIIMIIPTNLKEAPFIVIFKFAGKILLIMLPLLFLIRSIIPPDVVEIVDKNVLPWAFEMFQNDNGGKLETASSNELKGMYFEPSLQTFLIGDGYYVSPYDTTRYYMDTDAGYMRHILFYGIIGMIILSSAYLVIFYQMYANAASISINPIIKVFVILLTIYYFLSHIKGDLFLGSDIPIKALLLYYAIFVLYSDKKKSTNLTRYV